MDSDGNPIKRDKKKRTPKPVEEATIYYRLVQMNEKMDLAQAGYPSPEGSEKDPNEGEDPNEEKKGEDDGAMNEAAGDVVDEGQKQINT